MARLIQQHEEWRTGTGFLYQRMADNLCVRIHRGEWGIGCKIPGRHALAREYGTDLKTVEPAVARLIEAGLLRTVDRSGTYVARAVMPTDLHAPQPFLPVEAPQIPSAIQINGGATAAMMKPLIGVVMLGGYAPDDHSPDTDHWGNIAALAIERSLADVGGRAVFAVVGTLNESGDDLVYGDYFLYQRTVNAQIVVDTFGLLNREPDYLSKLETGGIPTVVIGADEVVTKLPFLTYDQQDAGYLAAEHLIQCGYRDLVYFRPFTARWVEERLIGIRAALARYHRDPDTLTVYPDTPLCDETTFYSDDYPYQRGRASSTDAIAGVHGLLSFLEPEAHRGVIASCDSFAFEIREAAQVKGITAGSDYGLVGFDDLHGARELGLTTYRVPMDAMGAEAVRMAMALLRNETINYRTYMRSTLIERASTHFDNGSIPNQVGWTYALS